jgi:hypothetical protein
MDEGTENTSMTSQQWSDMFFTSAKKKYRQEDDNFQPNFGSISVPMAWLD